MHRNQFALLVILLATTTCTLVVAQIGTCGGDCITSDTCADEAQDCNCRCSYFRCREYEEGGCGGGCVEDIQCSNWAGGDPNCVCGPLYECIDKSQLDSPGYHRFVSFMLSVKGGMYQKKLSEMAIVYKEKAAEVPKSNLSCPNH